MPCEKCQKEAKQMIIDGKDINQVVIVCQYGEGGKELDTKGLRTDCRWCDAELDMITRNNGFVDFIRCGKCGYDWQLWKLKPRGRPSE